MKLEELLDGSVIVTSGRRIYSRDAEDQLKQVGELPNPYSRLNGIRFDLKTGGLPAKVRRLVTGRIHSVNVWPLDKELMVANATNHLFRSRDGGRTWDQIKTLHPSSGIRGVLPGGLSYHDGTLYVGEYIFDESRSPRIYASDDLGETWRTELILDGVRHIHAVQPDPYTGDIWVATGDRDSESKIGRLVDGGLEVLGSGSQLWRAVELVFTPEYLLWGTDCSYQDNHVMRMPRDEFHDCPEPEPVFTVDGPFYYSTSFRLNGDTLAFFSTGGGFTMDSTAPDSTKRTTPTDREVGVYGGTSDSNFSEWGTLATFEVKKRLANRVGRPDLAANAYIFLESSPQRGVFVNPINTVTNDGEILNVDSNTLATSDLESAFRGL